jgi:hypothetical protein
MMDGLTHIISDVQNEYNGEDKYFITGFEPGAHTVWQMTFQHPEIIGIGPRSRKL